MKTLGWIVIAASSAVLACSSAQEISNAGDAGDSGDSGDSQAVGDSGTSRACPMPNVFNSPIVPGASCAVDPMLTCNGPGGPPKCAQCELIAMSCTCTSGTWACQDPATEACNARCPTDSGVDTGARDASVEAGDAAEQ